MHSLNKSLCTAPAIGYPRPGEFIVDTDVNNDGIWCVVAKPRRPGARIGLLQQEDIQGDRNYCVTRWKLLAVVKIVEHFHKYIHGQEFHLRTDHSALICLLSFKNME